MKENNKKGSLPQHKKKNQLSDHTLKGIIIFVIIGFLWKVIKDDPYETLIEIPKNFIICKLDNNSRSCEFLTSKQIEKKKREDKN